MRKVAIPLLAFFVITLMLFFSWLGSSVASAAQDTPTATNAADCNPKAAFDSIEFLSGQTTGDEANDLGLLKQARDAIDEQLSACNNIPTATPTVTETKEGTLTANEARTATRAVINDSRTATAVAKTATQAFVAQYKPIARGELASYADKHIGEKVKIQGRVFNVIDDQDVQMFLSDGATAVYVTTTTPFSAIYENDHVTVYGTVTGFFTGQNTLGGTIKQPQIAADLIVKG